MISEVPPDSTYSPSLHVYGFNRIRISVRLSPTFEIQHAKGSFPSGPPNSTLKAGKGQCTIRSKSSHQTDKHQNIGGHRPALHFSKSSHPQLIAKRLAAVGFGSPFFLLSHLPLPPGPGSGTWTTGSAHVCPDDIKEVFRFGILTSETREAAPETMTRRRTISRSSVLSPHCPGLHLGNFDSVGLWWLPCIFCNLYVMLKYNQNWEQLP